MKTHQPGSSTRNRSEISSRSFSVLSSSDRSPTARPASPRQFAARIAEPGGRYSTEEPGACAENKRIFSWGTAPQQLKPIKYQWAWQRYLDSSSRTWNPSQVDLSSDQAVWNEQHALCKDERQLVMRSLAQLNDNGLHATNSLVIGVHRHIDNPECRQYLLRQAYEEALHLQAYQQVISALGIDANELTSTYRGLTSAHSRTEWINANTRSLSDPALRAGCISSERKLLKALIACFIVVEGVFCHVALIPILNLGRRNKLHGSAQLCTHILRNEDSHAAFGIDVINQVKLESPQIWTTQLQTDCLRSIRQGVDLQARYTYEVMPRGTLGLNAPMLEEYQRFVANRRCAQIGLDEPFPGATNPFPWVAQIQTHYVSDQAPTTAASQETGAALDWDQ